MAATPATPDSDWRDGFLFVGNHLALDFVNTRPLQDGEFRELLPDFNALLLWLQSAGLLSPRAASELRKKWAGSARAARVLQQMRDWREQLREAVVTWERGKKLQEGAIKELNRLMQHYPMLTRVKSGDDGLQAETWFESKQPEDLFAPLAHSAAELFAGADRSRVRQCRNCVLHFLDTSKKGTRRWCSMRLCGNRLKVAAYAWRKRVEE